MAILDFMRAIEYHLAPGLVLRDATASDYKQPEHVAARSGLVWIADDLVLVSSRSDIIRAVDWVLESAPLYHLWPAVGKLCGFLPPPLAARARPVLRGAVDGGRSNDEHSHTLWFSSLRTGG